MTHRFVTRADLWFCTDLWSLSAHHCDTVRFLVICDFLTIFVSHWKYRRALIHGRRSHIWGPHFMVPEVMDHYFSKYDLVILSAALAIIHTFVWKYGLSEKRKHNRTNVIDRLHVVPSPPIQSFETPIPQSISQGHPFQHRSSIHLMNDDQATRHHNQGPFSVFCSA